MQLTKDETVRVYYNIHRRTFSIQTKTDKGWRVTCHMNHVCLRFPKFLVSETGWQRALKQKRRNVHAKIQGKFKPQLSQLQANICNGVKARYSLSSGQFQTIEPMPEKIQQATAVALYIHNNKPQMHVKPLTSPEPTWAFIQ